MTVALFDVFGTLLTFSDWRQPVLTLTRPLGLSLPVWRSLRTDMMTRDIPDLDAVAAFLASRFPDRPQPDHAALAKARAELATQQASCHPIPGALEALDALRARGWKLALVTNLATPYAHLLSAHGLTERVDAVVCSCAVGLAKPDPAIFRHALQQLGAKAEDAVMIGDSARADVAGARAAGLRPLWIHPHRGDISSVAEVPQLLLKQV